MTSRMSVDPTGNFRLPADLSAEATSENELFDVQVLGTATPPAPTVDAPDTTPFDPHRQRAARLIGTHQTFNLQATDGAPTRELRQTIPERLYGKVASGLLRAASLRARHVKVKA